MRFEPHSDVAATFTFIWLRPPAALNQRLPGPRPFSNLLLVAVGQNPVLLFGVEEKAEDVKVQSILLVRGSFVGANQQAALHLRVR